MKDKNINFIYFGTGDFGAKVLETLIESGFTPSLVVTAPDRPAGRKMILTPPPVKIIAQECNLKIIQPEKLNSEDFTNYELFIVADYGKIIPKLILEIPKHGTLNVHPSLLPKYRGPSPIQSFILSGEEETGVTIMLIDEQVDHGPIIAQQLLKKPNYKNQITNKSEVKNLKLNAKELGEDLAKLGGEILADIIPKWINGEIKAAEQDHEHATFTKKFSKEDGLVDIERDHPKTVYRKFLAFQPWPGIYFFSQRNGKNIRVIITDMELSEQGELKINKVKPEGKSEMDYQNFI